MRLALAAAVLAQSLPASSSLTVDDAPPLGDTTSRHVNGMPAAGVDRLHRRGRRSGGFLTGATDVRAAWPGTSVRATGGGSVLRNVVAAAAALPGSSRDPVSCDPAAPADAGVLSCGMGRYCAESADSALGGVCRDSATTGREQRTLQDVNATTELAYTFQDLCVEKADICNCTTYDATAYTLDVQCGFPSACKDEYSDCYGTVNHCFSALITGQFLGPGMHTTTRCYMNTAPYEQEICYTGATSGDADSITSCEMTFGGVPCNSCEVKYPYLEDCDEFGYCETDSDSTRCYYFDCTNTPGMHSGNSCNLEGSPIFNFIATDGCTTNCELCPGGAVATPNSTVPGYVLTLPSYDLYCTNVEFVAKNGFHLTEATCAELQSGLAGFCCGQGPATLPPDWTQPPTDAPGIESASSAAVLAGRSASVSGGLLASLVVVAAAAAADFV